MAKKIIISSSSVLLCLLLAAFLLSLLPGQSNPTDASALPDQPQSYEDLTNYTSVEELIDALLENGAEDANLPQTIYNLANTHWYAGEYEQARQLYKYIADNMPDSDLAFNARAWVAGSDIKLANFDDAEEEIDALIKDFAGHPQLTTIIYKLADYYWYAERYQDAKVLYQSVFDRDAQGDLAIWAKAWVAGADIWLGNYEAAQQRIDALVKDFPRHPDLTRLTYKLANQYWHVDKFDEARRLYQYVLETDPNGELAVWANAWMTGFELMLDNSTSAEQVIDVLTNDFDQHPGLAEIIYGIANGCWYVEKYDQAQILYKYIADNMPNSNFAPRAQLWVAGSDIILANYAAAHEGINALTTNFSDLPNHPELARMMYQLARMYWRVQRCKDSKYLCQLLLDNWPDSEHAGQALFLIGNYYESLRNSGALPESEANTKIKQAYETVVKEYPHSQAVREASIKLGWLDFKKGQWLQATHYWELSLNKSTPDDRPLHILYSLGRAYEEMGQFDKAEQLYNEFINSAPSFDPRTEKIKLRLQNFASENSS